MATQRRQFLKAAWSATAAPVSVLPAIGLRATQASADDPPQAPRKGNPIGVSTYSFWQFRGERLPMERCIDQAAAMGFDGVEILHVQMADETNSAAQKLKQQAHHAGLALMGFSTHQGFVHPDPAVRKDNVQKTLYQIDLAYRLGIPTMRINTGRWGTIQSFDELMKNRGMEPPLEGVTEEEAFGWVIAAIEQLLPRAEECGVTLGLENHWGLGRTAAGVLRIVEAIRSPWLRLTLDTGNFLENAYEQMEQMAKSRAGLALVQAKTYFGGGRWYSIDLDYGRIAAMLRSHGYGGWISLEFEGNEDAGTAVPKSLELLRRHFSA